jgi:hypothetical protein
MSGFVSGAMTRLVTGPVTGLVSEEGGDREITVAIVVVV